ncbi:uncharacterized protein F4822DRAFT_267857 [Hypoxylon trugodes]|uniref:uncharacterized protein n=1 Tax=Hypoxylon trugodes TaxID=326681 RepID=UPI0021998DE6|nr:uncharacterized protein F4822DRAFT_267857 [Hypoxylon trugodes]KAI1389042.1 hypothetical protein F4822DRAFT_267857 [Hypoxylon trugodes]
MAENQMDQSQARRRRRDGSSGVQQRLCTHCGRSFKRSEHLERHVRTHTKEKPYVCHCGSAYSRRDLLTRHQRITHETLSPRSPDAPTSEDNHQLAAADSDPTSEDLATASSTASLPDMSMNHNIQQTQYSNASHDFAIHNHPVSQQYHQLTTDQEFFNVGQHFPTFDQFPDLHNFPDGLPPEWNTYLDGAGQEMVDPALRGSMADVSSPLTNDNFPVHAYNTWMSSAAQEWGG